MSNIVSTHLWYFGISGLLLSKRVDDASKRTGKTTPRGAAIEWWDTH